MKVTTKITYNAAKLASALPRIISKTTSRYARLSAKGAKKNIDRGVKPPLKQSTLNIRHNKGITGTKPLYETGNLHRSIKAKGDTLTMNDYGFQHQHGFTTGASSAVPKKKVPARPFIEPDKQEILTVLDAFKKDISTNFRR
tara:strand:- start:954 stop:1379 length:426 start_codon:yes stop_codon:yes gene_type:complete